jgi:anti-sigma factor RsiW
VTDIRHHVAEDEAQLYLEDAVEPAEAARIDAHLAGCVECQALLASFEALSQALSALPLGEPPADFTAGVMARIDERERAKAGERRVVLTVLAAVSAALAVALLVAGQAAWAPALSAVSSVGVRALQAVRISSDVLSPLVSALRLEIIVVSAAIGIPLLLAVSRLAVPRQGQVA